MKKSMTAARSKEDFYVPFVTRGLALVKAFPGSSEGTRADSTYRRIGYIELEKKGSDVGGMTYPDITSESQSLRGYGPVRRPWPMIDSSGFFGMIDAFHEARGVQTSENMEKFTIISTARPPCEKIAAYSMISLIIMKK
jgi:hypothetical protein